MAFLSNVGPFRQGLWFGLMGTAIFFFAVANLGYDGGIGAMGGLAVIGAMFCLIGALRWHTWVLTLILSWGAALALSLIVMWPLAFLTG